MLMNAILTAGGIPQVGEPLFEFTLGQPKALLDIAGKPMIQWVLDAISEAHFIHRVVVVGLEEGIPLYCTKPMTILPQQGGLFENLLAAVKTLQAIEPAAKKVIAVSSDVPVLKGFMLDWFIDEVLKSNEEVYYTVIAREVMEARFPQARRSYYRLKDVEVCGADVHAFDMRVITHRPLLWQKLFATRKNAFKQASLIGFDVFLAFLFRRWTLDKVAQKVAQKVGVRGRAILCPYPELGMDVDKPAHYHLVMQDLQRAYVEHGLETINTVG